MSDTLEQAKVFEARLLIEMMLENAKYTPETKRERLNAFAAAVHAEAQREAFENIAHEAERIISDLQAATARSGHLAPAVKAEGVEILADYCAAYLTRQAGQ